jgi:hypothetical protein
MQCDGCKVDTIDVQVRMAFRALPAEQAWSEFSVLATVCPKCGGKMEFHVAVPPQFELWVTGKWGAILAVTQNPRGKTRALFDTGASLS